MHPLILLLAAAPPPIVNGEKTDNYPEVVLLRHTTANGAVAFTCTGTLVSPTAILTAAHCLADVDGYNLTDMRVSSGSVWSNDVPERKAVDWYMHPDYAVNGTEIVADLGVVLLDEPYTMAGRELKSDALTTADIGRSLRYVGWGASSDNANDSGFYKRVANIPLQGFEGEFLLAYDGENGSATCGGDSGGPVFEIVDGEIAGLVAVHSFGRDDDGTICAGSISGDTQVAAYLEWIVDETGAQTDLLLDEAETEGDQDSGNDRAAAESEVTGACSSASGAGSSAWLAAIAGLAALAGRHPLARGRASACDSRR